MPPSKVKMFKENPTPLDSLDTAFEIGIDEAGFVAAVVLPKDSESFHHEWMRDSKKSNLKNHDRLGKLHQTKCSADADAIDRQILSVL